MSKWKCEICNSEFDNFHAQGFNHKIYCPLCYFKELNNRKDKEIARLNKIIDELEKLINKEKNRLIEIAESKGIVIDKSLSERIDHKVGTFEYVLDKLKELKEEGN